MRRFVKHKFTFLIFFCLFSFNFKAQQKIQKLIENKKFTWKKDTLSSNIYIYHENSISKEKSVELEKIVQSQILQTIKFLGIAQYKKPIHYFIVDNREKMKLLLGRETNGTANYKENYITAIYSEHINSVSSNHELFHLMAMNIWGTTELWLNEGMAVYSDNLWNGHQIDKFSKFLIDNNKYISITKIAKNVRKYDSNTTYPLLGSFVKFLEKKYGREFIIDLWEHTSKINRINIKILEKEWIDNLNSIKY